MWELFNSHVEQSIFYLNERRTVLEGCQLHCLNTILLRGAHEAIYLIFDRFPIDIFVNILEGFYFSSTRFIELAIEGF